MHFVFVVIILLFPFSVLGDSHDISIYPENSAQEEGVFTYARGSKNNYAYIIENKTENDVMVKVDVVTGQEGDDVMNISLYDESLDATLRQKISENKDNIVIFCEKNSLEEVRTWCEGEDNLELAILSGEKKRIPMTIDVPDKAGDHTVQLRVLKIENEEESVIFDQKLQYKAPDKNIKKVDLNAFSIEKKQSGIDFATWLHSGMKDEYIVRYTLKNIGTEDVNYNIFSETESLWIGEVITEEKKGSMKVGEEHEGEMIVVMPRFGKMNVRGGVYYVDQEGDHVTVSSESVQVFIWPAHLIIFLGITICFCAACVLLYIYVKKNMFGRKKKKKKNNYNETYVVRDADNIISIAKHYNVSWKELAKSNDIEPPYILISGETINVPGEADLSVPEDAVGEEKSVVQESSEGEDSPGLAEDHEIESEQVPEQQNEEQHVVSDTVRPVEMIEAQLRGVDGTVYPEQDQELQSQKKAPKKRSVTFASPKNMLTQPSSEPTTRAIDIEWMRDDEAAYLEEMQVQEKQINTRFLIICGAVGVVVVGLVWWGVVQYMKNQEQKAGMSVEELIEKDIEQLQEEQERQNEQGSPDDSQETDSVTETNKEDDEGGEKDGEEEKKQESVEQASLSEVTVQVLNAGSVTGAAGAVSKEFEDSGYTVNDATNSQNDYQGVVIYYKKDISENIINEAEKRIGDKYGKIVKEESDSVVEKYNADVVVVLGS